MSAVLKRPEAYDPQLLDKEMDRTKADVFMGSNAAFFGSLLCSLRFRWTESLPTAGTDGVELLWNPGYFLKLPRASRKTDLMHELWHVARLHMIRRGSREMRLWNVACDIRIDLDLEADGYTFEGIEGVLTWKSLDARKYVQPWLDEQGQAHKWTEERIYDDLQKSACQVPQSYVADIQEGGGSAQAMQAVNAVVKAAHQTKLTGAGSMPGDVEEILSVFLAPVVPWERIIHQFMTDLQEDAYTWRRPNRRFTDMYLPSRQEEEGRLAHLAYFEDVSGSISRNDLIRFNSEFRYVKETYRPKKMTLLQFDTKIQQELHYGEEDRFDHVPIKGRGGTSLVCVRDWIIQHRPTAAVIFSDLYCEPMKPLPFSLPVLWVAINNKAAEIPFGQITHIN